MLRSFSTRSLLLVPALLGLALVAGAGCSDGSEEPAQGPTQVEGKGDLNSSSQAVSLANLQMVNGTYGAGCTSRSGSWSLPLAGYGGALDNTALTVVTNDAACTLTVTGIKASGTLFSATPVIPLGTGFAGSASLFQSPAVPASITVSTLAGNGQGYSDGTGSGALFAYPHDTTVDSSGNTFVVDSVNHRIRKITPAGVVTTFAGSGAIGTADGTGVSAQFHYPHGLTLDSSGNLFVSDTSNHRIRKITPGGVVTTLAGSSVGSADGTGASAQFNLPHDLSLDGSGNIFVTEYGNNRVRKITPGGVVTTLAGSTQGFADGTGASAQFNGPEGLIVASSGDIFVADTSNHRIRKITPAGVVTTVAGNGVAGFADGTGAGAQFNQPKGLATDSSGDIIVADAVNNRVRKVTPAGVVTTLAGSGAAGSADGPGASAQLNFPTGLATSPSGEILVADTFNHRIRKLVSSGGTPAELFYGNAKVNTSTFASSFVVNLLLSDDPGTAAGSNNAIFASVSGSSQTDLVPPPNYTFSTAGITVQADVNGLVTSVVGNLALTDGSNTGSGYVINLGTLPATPTFTEYDTAYNGGSAVAISGANPAIAASSMLAVGVQLPATRTVIVRRSDNGVIAYQALKITFNAP